MDYFGPQVRNEKKNYPTLLYLYSIAAEAFDRRMYLHNCRRLSKIMVINMRLCQPSAIIEVVTFSLHQKLRVINVHTYLGILHVHTYITSDP